MKKNRNTFTRTRRVGWLPRLSGRDPETLSLCPEDEHASSAVLSVSMLTGTAIHMASMTAALSVLNVPLEIACAIGAVTGLGVFAADRAIVQAGDLGRAEAAVRRIGATDIPRLSGVWGRLPAKLMRVAFSLTTAVALAGFVGLRFHDADLRTVITAEQAVLDAPLITAAQERWLGRYTILTGQLEDTRAQLDHLDQKDARVAQGQAGTIAAAQKEVDRITSQITDLAAESSRWRTEGLTQRDLAACELSGKAPGCEKASGIPKPGPRYRLAVKRAEAAEAEEQRLTSEIAALRARQSTAQTALQAARAGAGTAPPASPRRDALEQRAAQIRADLARHEDTRAAQVADMVARDPARVERNADSLAERIKALGQLAQDPAFALSMLAIKLMAFMLEMLPMIVASMAVPAEYALLRGKRLASMSRELINLHADETISDLDLRLRSYHARQAERSERRAAQPEMQKLRDDIRREDLRATAGRKRRANDWLEQATRISTPSKGD